MDGRKSIIILIIIVNFILSFYLYNKIKTVLEYKKRLDSVLESGKLSDLRGNYFLDRRIYHNFKKIAETRLFEIEEKKEAEKRINYVESINRYIIGIKECITNVDYSKSDADILEELTKCSDMVTSAEADLERARLSIGVFLCDKEDVVINVQNTLLKFFKEYIKFFSYLNKDDYKNMNRSEDAYNEINKELSTEELRICLIAEGGNRTRTPIKALDFKSNVSANSTTTARSVDRITSIISNY